MLNARLCVFGWLLLGLCSTALAQAPATDSTARARELFDNGAALYDEGNYQAAIIAFQESYNLSKAPVLLFNIANCQERLGDLKAARDALNVYRAVAPAEERTALERRIANLEERIAQQAAATPAPAPVAAAPVVAAPAPAAPPATPASVATVPAPSDRRGGKIALIAGGSVATLVGGGLAWYGASSAGAAIDALDRDAYDLAALLNKAGYGLGALGAASLVVGVVLPGHSADLSLAPTAGGLRLGFTSSW